VSIQSTLLLMKQMQTECADMEFLQGAFDSIRKAFVDVL
jgi:hypothetical protein